VRSACTRSLAAAHPRMPTQTPRLFGVDIQLAETHLLPEALVHTPSPLGWLFSQCTASESPLACVSRPCPAARSPRRCRARQPRRVTCEECRGAPARHNASRASLLSPAGRAASPSTPRAQHRQSPDAVAPGAAATDRVFCEPEWRFVIQVVQNQASPTGGSPPALRQQTLQ
jgi:hypothetical protein